MALIGIYWYKSDRMETHFPIALQEPPIPVAMGVGVHGVQSPEDRYCLPALWSLHVYGYRGTPRGLFLTVSWRPA